MSKEVRSSDHAEAPIQSHEIRDVQQTTCVIVGAGPAGAVLSFMLARKGIDVMLLESHLDFDGNPRLGFGRASRSLSPVTRGRLSPGFPVGRRDANRPTRNRFCVAPAGSAGRG